MNYHVDMYGTYYCLDPIHPRSNYTYHYRNNLFYLICHQDDSINLIHRIDGPAEANVSGNKYWCFMGKYHREDRPAIECQDGEKRWYYHGEKINCSSNDEFLKIIAMKAFL